MSNKKPSFVESSYEILGASASKSGLHASLKKAGRENESGFFASMNEDIAGDKDYLSFIHCDGAGTKSIVAYLLFRETGLTEVFKGLAQDALVMNLDDMYAVGPVEGLLLANTIARNAKLITDDAVSAIITGYGELVENMRSLGISIALSGGETADMGDVVRTLVVDAVLCGRLKKASAVNTKRIAAGDIIIGLSSTGKATYESKPNSGVASNGLTLARHALLSKDYREKFPEVSAAEIDLSVSYRGPFKLSDSPAGLGMTLGEALLSPTRSYAPVLKRLFEALGPEVHGVVHLTGGGQTKPLRFGENLRFRKNNLFPIPPLFQLIEEHGGVPRREMYQVFNMGHRMEIYCAAKHFPMVEVEARSLGVEARIIGHVEASDSRNEVIVEAEGQSFEYRLG